MTTVAELQQPILVEYDSQTTLPLELVESLNRAYFLHLLATSPDKVIPPGKSLISLVTQEQLATNLGDSADKHNNVERHISSIMQAAFWDTVAHNLSSPEPSEQNIALKRILSDIHDAIATLLPHDHPLLHTLSLPPRPSTAPLYSFIESLKDVLKALRERCAPIRDNEIDSLMQSLEYPPAKDTTPKSLGSRPASPVASPLAKFTTDHIQDILEIIEHMKTDLHNFMLGTMAEEQLQSLVRNEAKTRERDLVVKLWSLNGQRESKRTEEAIRKLWREWCEQLGSVDIPREEKWKSSLVQTLSMHIPISCKPSQIVLSNTSSQPRSRLQETSEKNELPPQFFFSSPALYRLQDYFQAVVIAASLRSFTRLPINSPPPQSSSASNFMERVWSLLHDEIESTSEASDNPLKIINLADEVIRARRFMANFINEEEERHIREAVQRTLRPRDPVFLLLQKRLMDALLKGLLTKETIHDLAQTRVPGKLRTGRDLQDAHRGKRSKAIFDEEEGGIHDNAQNNVAGVIQPIKGFEDPVLVKAIDLGFSRLLNITIWIESVWGDLV